MRRSLFLLFTFLAVGSINAYDCCGSRWDNAPTTPTACGTCGEDGGFYLDADLLYWKLIRSDLDYAIGGTTSNPRFTDAVTHYVDRDWELGFHAELGMCDDCDGWEFSLGYTHMDVKCTSSVDAPGGGNLMPTLMHAAGTGQFASAASATYTVDYDVIDLTSGRPYFISCSLLLRPFSGLRVLWMDQHMYAEYTGVDFAANTGSSDWRADLFGYGFYGGLETARELLDFCGGKLTTFGQIGTSVITTNTDATYSILEGGSAQVGLKDDEKATLICGLEAYGGVSYETCLDWCGCGGNLIITVAGQSVKWSNTPRQRRFVDDSHEAIATSGQGGVLGFDGFSLSARVDF
ncbi:MAG: hypothetical protein KDK78_04405 [Chlamydiia bacterium]|nr:hypothetical protein [Chlamydiia bacterium]